MSHLKSLLLKLTHALEGSFDYSTLYKHRMQFDLNQSKQFIEINSIENNFKPSKLTVTCTVLPSFIRK